MGVKVSGLSDPSVYSARHGIFMQAGLPGSSRVKFTIGRVARAMCYCGIWRGGCFYEAVGLISSYHITHPFHHGLGVDRRCGSSCRGHTFRVSHTDITACFYGHYSRLADRAPLAMVESR